LEKDVALIVDLAVCLGVLVAMAAILVTSARLEQYAERALTRTELVLASDDPATERPSLRGEHSGRRWIKPPSKAA
jgi:hypothetical protein